MQTAPGDHETTSAPLISLVMPAHNEREGIESAVRAATETLERIAPDRWELIVVDDASTDGTGELLAELTARRPGVEVVRLPANVGHGPALRRGWEQASGTWIAQLDSDEEVPADQLLLLWQAVDAADLAIGVRADRTSTPVRRLVTAVLKVAARLVGGRPLADANCPCKIVRAEAMRAALALVPPDAFAPSALVAVATARRGDRIVQVPVASRPRRYGRSWLVPTRLAKGAARSMLEMIALGWRMRRRRALRA